MHVLMFYLLDNTLIISLISSVVTHLTLKLSLCILSYLTLPTELASRLPTGELEVADGVGENVFVCICASVEMSAAFVQFSFKHVHLSVFACASVNLCDRC